MNLSPEEKKIHEGARGLTYQKVMKTLVLYGNALGADRFVDIEGPGHFSIPFCVPGVGARLEMLDELAEAGLSAKFGFTLDPCSPLDFDNLAITTKQESIFNQIFSNQKAYDKRMLQLGLRDETAYTCTPYFPEVDNIPAWGTILAWSESSCVVYANSVLGARTNRNAAILDILSNIAGKTPLTGFLTDQGRRATWRVEVRTRHLPNPQLLGAALGIKVIEDVPYIVGLERFLDSALTPETIDFLKEMGAACAALGAVGLYHIKGITPEAVDQGDAILMPNHRTFVIDDRMIEEMFAAYPVMWTDKRAEPQKCFIGCPHLSFRELHRWTDDIVRALKDQGRERVAIETILCAAPQVIDRFKADPVVFNRFKSAGIRLSSTCPEAYMMNQSCSAEAVVTNSNKFRAFTPARMFLDPDLVQIVVTGKIPRR